MTYIAIVAGLLTIGVVPAFAQDVSYQCTNGTLERRVEIVSEGGLGLPCEVHYYKDTEMPGERQVLWTAQNVAGYCEEKATAFVSRLQGWGFSCSTGDVAPAAEEADDAETADDTADLTPVDDTGGN